MSGNVIESLASNPAVKEVMLAQISTRQAELQAELSELEAAATSLNGDEAPEAPKKRGRPAKSAGAPKGRPKGKRTGPSQRVQVLTLIAKSKSGLKFEEICEKSKIDKQVLHTLLSVMKNKSNLVKTSGKSRKQKGDGFTYSITKAGTASLNG